MNAPRPYTQGQQDKLKELLVELAVFDRTHATKLWETLRDAEAKDELTSTAASLMITSLIQTVRVAKRTAEGKALLASATTVSAEEGIEIAKQRNEREDVPSIPEGRYAVATDAGHLAFYRVSVNEKSGYVTVELQVSENFQKLPWAQTKTILRKIAEVGVLEASMTYGREMEICGRCGRALTNPQSRAEGIGPTCKGLLGQ